MTIAQILKTAGEKNPYMDRTWTDDELEIECEDREGKGQPVDMQRLFCLTKALCDPSPEVKAEQERMRMMRLPEKDIIEFSILREMKRFSLPWSCAEAIGDALHHVEQGFMAEQIQKMEWWYDLECM